MYGLTHQATPSLKRFPTSFEDNFSDVVSAFDNVISQEVPDEEKAVDRDHKLLSFSVPSLDYVLLDYTYRQTSISLSAQLHGMFFMAESPWANTGDGTSPPAELTCYRRNLFQITGNITLPRTLRYILTNEGKQIPILSQELAITATESTEGNPVKVISVPWKTPANTNTNPPAIAGDDKVEKEPATIPLDMTSIQDLDGTDYASFPFQWKRLQFRIATANNGRRKELQQHFLLHLKVMANLATGGKVAIASAQSGAIIVRGRSPRNFQSRKDTPLTGAGNHVRKASGMPAHLNRVNSVESVGSRPPQNSHLKNDPTSNPIKAEAAPQPPMSINSFYDPGDFPLPSGGLFQNTFLPDPHQQAQQQAQQQLHGRNQGAMTAIPPDALFDTSAAAANFRRGYPLSSPDLSRPTPNMAAAILPQALPTPTPIFVPQKLSLVDEETPKPTSISPKTMRKSPPRLTPHSSLNSNPNSFTSAGNKHGNTDNTPPYPAKRQAMAPPSGPPQQSHHQRVPSTFSLNVVSSPDESADLLYEYFPLTLDDWMPPVDAVYRPHVVHHIKPLNPLGPESGLGRNGSGGGGMGMKSGMGVFSAGKIGGSSAGVAGWGRRSKRYFSEDVG